MARAQRALAKHVSRPAATGPHSQLSALPMSYATKTALGADPVALRGKIALGTVSVARGSLRFLANLSSSWFMGPHSVS